MSSPDPDQPLRLDRGPHTVAYSITVDAAAQTLWEIAANPHRHHELDGSGTVRSTARGPEQLSEGDRFSVDTKKFGLAYALKPVVTAAEPPHGDDTGVVEWRQPTGHRWRWEFEASDAQTTRVTESYDASDQQALLRRGLNLAKVQDENARSIRASLRKLRTSFTR